MSANNRCSYLVYGTVKPGQAIDIMHIVKSKFTELRDVRTVAFLADPACRACWKSSTPPLLEYVWRKHRPELFLVAGDLAVHGISGEYREFISALKRYPAWLAAVPGDHDKPLKAFMSHFGSTRKVLDAGKWRFIGLNTANRIFPAQEAEFLESHLRPNTVIFTHIPPGVKGWTFHSLRPFYSSRFLSIISRHASKIKAVFFGHIHGYSRTEHACVPLFTTGGVAESRVVSNNRYAGPDTPQMMIFKTETGELIRISHQGSTAAT